MLFLICITSFRYTIIDPAEVSKYALYYALRNHLDNNVKDKQFYFKLFIKIYSTHKYLSLEYLQEVDMIPYTFDQTLENMKHMALTNALWIDPSTILQPWPEEESRLKVTIRPFELPVCFKCNYLIKHNFNICLNKRYGFAFLCQLQFLYNLLNFFIKL